MPRHLLLALPLLFLALPARAQRDTIAITSA